MVTIKSYPTQMANIRPTKMWQVLAIRVLEMCSRMYPTLNNYFRDTKTSSKDISRLISKASSKEISSPISRGLWRFLSSPAPLDVSIQSLGAPWLVVTTLKQWYLKWGRTLSTSYEPPNAALKKVANNMSQVIAGRPYVHVARHPHTTNLFAQLRGFKWWTSSQPIKWCSVTRTRQINT